jgi:hypothetical protein
MSPLVFSVTTASHTPPFASHSASSMPFSLAGRPSASLACAALRPRSSAFE